MAAVTSGRRSRRKSRRTASACAFLSNISLDGNVVQDVLNACETEMGHIHKTESTDWHSHRERLLHSISEPSNSSTSEDIKELTIIPKNINEKILHRERSVTDVVSERCPQEKSVVIQRSVSLSESNASSSLNESIRRSKSKISCLTGNSFHLKRRATDKRIVLCSGYRTPFITYSVLKYHKDNQEAGQEGMRRISTIVTNQFVGIEGVELGSADKTVSYRSLLTSTYPFGWKEEPSCQGTGTPLTKQVDPGSTSQESPDAGFISLSEYDPHLLDDPELTSGRHRKVLSLPSYLVSMVAYAKPSELKKDLNEQFREKFPNLNITLTKLRSLKKDIVKIASTQECSLDSSTIAYAFVYFEKLVLKEKISKANRKLLAGSCLLLAAKFNDDMRREKVKELIEVSKMRHGHPHLAFSLTAICVNKLRIVLQFVKSWT